MKRQRSESSPDMQDEPMEAAAASGGTTTSNTAASGAGTTGGLPGGTGRGNAIFPSGVPLKGINHHTKTFTKKFYFKIYANDWMRVVRQPAGVDIVHFGTYIPYQALCMYLSPQEYMEIVRGSHFCKVQEARFELRFKAIRTPFDANSTDAAEANGNLQFEIQRWDGLEHMLPFQALDYEGRGQATVTGRATYLELITRLYGAQAFGKAGVDPGGFRWPATMRERGLSWRPTWSFPTGGADATAPANGMYRNINRFISSLPVGEYITDSMNTNAAKMSEGYCFNKIYRPRNGVLSFASSAVAPQTLFPAAGKTRINTKMRLRDRVMNQTADPVTGDLQYETLFGNAAGGAQPTDTVLDLTDTGVKVGNPSAGTTFIPYATTGEQRQNTLPRNISRFFAAAPGEDYNRDPTQKTFVTPSATPLNATGDGYGYGYNNQMYYYSTANLENYDFFSPSHDPPVHHMPSMIIGIVPKTNSDESIVNATAEFECTTSITIKCEDTHPTYMQCAYANGQDGYGPGYVDDLFNDRNFYGGRWQHNEKEVSLRDNKYWIGDYGLAGKPLFRDYPLTDPLF